MHYFKLSRRIARFRALLFAVLFLGFAGCDNADSFTPDSSTPPDGIDPIPSVEEDTPLAPLEDLPLGDGEAEIGPAEPAVASATYAGGIPFGIFALPVTQLGTPYNGAKWTLDPSYMLAYLQAVRSRGSKVVLSLAGRDVYYKDADGHFSFTKWKARVDRFRKVNFSSYINDGTIVGHYMIDEPQDKANWNGTTVPGATLEAMAKYSKAIWPNLVTIVRAPPGKIKWSGTYRYLDAAWAQVADPWGTLNVSSFTSQNISDAKSLGLQIIVGLNISKGGRNKGPMTASQVKSFGSTLLSSTYPCAFLSWTYSSTYLATTSIKDAMKYLRSKAQNRSFKSCR